MKNAVSVFCYVYFTKLKASNWDLGDNYSAIVVCYIQLLSFVKNAIRKALNYYSKFMTSNPGLRNNRLRKKEAVKKPFKMIDQQALSFILDADLSEGQYVEVKAIP